jgi:signal transduction histidine kinase
MRSILLVVLVTLLATPPAYAASEFGTREEAVAMVHRVEEMLDKDGVDATFEAVDDKTVQAFHDRDLYPFVYDLEGVCVAHGVRPALIGKKLIDIKDQDGNFLIREMLKIVNGSGSGWVDYKWPHPITNKIEDKSAYVEKLGTGYFVGVGVYKQ